MEELENIPKKVYEAVISSLRPMPDIGASMMCVSGDPQNKIKSPCIQIDQSMLSNGQQTISGIFTSFPIYNSELANWAPGKKIKITVELA